MLQTTIDLSSIVQLAKDQFSCELDGGVAIVSMRTGMYYGLDSVGAYIWSLLASPTTVRTICDAMQRKYDVDRDLCERDAIALLERLMTEGLLETCDEATA